jgi:hypothetical protein
MIRTKKGSKNWVPRVYPLVILLQVNNSMIINVRLGNQLTGKEKSILIGFIIAVFKTGLGVRRSMHLVFRSNGI